MFGKAYSFAILLKYGVDCLPGHPPALSCSQRDLEIEGWACKHADGVTSLSMGSPTDFEGFF